MKNALIASAKSKAKADSAAGKMYLKLNAAVVDKLSKMFRTCHAMIIKNRPISDFGWLCELDVMKGLDLGETYRNSEAAKGFIKAIAEHSFQEVSNQVQDSKFVCFIGDGSTDSSVKEQEMWYLRSCKEGVISVNFIGVHAAERADASSIVEGLKQTVKSNLKIDWEDISQKMVALACDGASVMLGSKAGVGALLRREQPSVISIHCMAHRLELALKDASKNIKLYDKTVNVLAMGLYYFYHNSALNRAMLVRSYKSMVENATGDPLLPTRVGGTRWVGHTLRAITNLTTSYSYIVQHLGQLSEPTERVSVDSKSKAVAFLRLLKSKDVLCFLFLLLDVLSPLSRLSHLLQNRTCVIGQQHAEISTVIEVIEKMKTKDGPNLRKVSGLSQYEGTQLTHCNVSEFLAAKNSFLCEIDQALKKRFADFSSPTVLQSTKIADISKWPTTWEELKVYGDDDLVVMIDHFKGALEEANVDTAEAELEWTPLKKELYDESLKQGKECKWTEVHKLWGEKFPNILPVMDLILTLSPSSSEAERGFSQLKLIKNNLRSRLSQSALNHCMAIKMLAPAIKTFNPLPAIHHWNNMSEGTRRPFYKDNIKSKLHTLELQTPQPQVTASGDSEVKMAENSDEEPDEPEVEVAGVSAAQEDGKYFDSDSSDSDYDSGLEEDMVFAKLTRSM